MLFVLLADLSMAKEGNKVKSSTSIRILYPQPDSLVDREFTHLVAKIGGGKIAYVVVKVNEHISPLVDMSTEIYKEVLKDILIVRMYMLPGKNVVEVTGKDETGKDLKSVKVNLFYRDPFGAVSSLISRNFSKKLFHSEEGEKPCRECHRMKVDPAVDLEPVNKEDILCVSCHDADMQRKYMHGEATWQCLACHDDEGSPKYALRDMEGSFCLNCHGAYIDYLMEMKTVHVPVKEKRCLVCHNEHSAKDEPLLKNSVNEVCYACHQDKFDGKHITPGHPVWAQKDPSREGKNLNCVSCHNPMAANMERLLKYEPGMTMCQVCHVK
jgi:predicted CXXCH cytochrome family protein